MDFENESLKVKYARNTRKNQQNDCPRRQSEHHRKCAVASLIKTQINVQFVGGGGVVLAAVLAPGGDFFSFIVSHHVSFHRRVALCAIYSH